MKKLLPIFLFSLCSLQWVNAQCTDTVKIINVIVSDAFCGWDNGWIDFDVEGGQAPYTYQWDQGMGNQAPPISVWPGTFTVVVTDNNGCTATNQFWVNGEEPIRINENSINPSCWGSNDGSISVTVTGGVPPYTYGWTHDNTLTTSTIDNLAAATYTVFVTDNWGCMETLRIRLSNPAGLTLSVVPSPDYCQQCNGNANATINGGRPPYQFVFDSDPPGAPQGPGNLLCAGDYIATVSDANGCTITTPFTVPAVGATDSIGLEIGVEPISCAGDCSGYMEVNAFCGISPYTYAWSHDPSISTSLQNNLCADTYTVTVTDNDGQTAIISGDVEELTSPLFLSSGITHVTCPSDSTGFIDLNVSGGDFNYSYSWSNGVTTQAIDGLAAGTYTVTVTDGLGCTLVKSLEVLSASNLQIDSFNITPACNNDGSAQVITSGGIGALGYSWSTGATGTTITGLASGTYTVTITDSLSCALVEQVVVTPSINFEVNTTSTTCDNLNGTAAVRIIGGSSAPQISWSNGGAGLSQNSLTAGWYSVTVEDAINGCREHQNFEVIPDSSCFVTISGYVYNDKIIADCAQDINTKPIRFIRVDLSNGQSVFTDIDGFYRFRVPADTYTLSVDLGLVGAFYDPLCSDPKTIVATSIGASYENNNFYLKGKTNFDLAIKVTKGLHRPGREGTVSICLMNFGDAPISGTLTFNHDPQQTYRGANFPETSYDASSATVTWDFTDLPPGPIRVYRVKMYTPTTIPVGTLLSMSFQAAPINGDQNPSNNTLLDCITTVRNSYDPNDKAVTPVGEGLIGRIDQAVDSVLEYRVRFQNTGNDTAFTVVVQDILDEDLNWRTVRPGAATHPYVLRIIDGRKLEFRFDNINLPDSTTNFNESIGTVWFTVQLKKDRDPGVEVNNHVDIYFDFNSPVRTNTVTNTIRGEDVLYIQDLSGCNSYTYNGINYSSDTVLVDTVALLLYDSTTLTRIQVLSPVSTSAFVQLCEGDTYHGVIYTSSTTITEYFIAVNGCDSVVTTQINVLPSYEEQESVSLCAGESYLGTVYSSSTVIMENYQTIAGCDSIVTVTITVNQAATMDQFVEVCEGEEYNGEVITADRVFTQNLQTQYGCDSVVTTHVTVTETITTSASVSLCSGDTYRGTVYTSNTTLSDYYASSIGCDSLVITDVIVHPTYSLSVFVDVCEGDIYEGMLIENDTVFTIAYSNVFGCDSTLTWNINALPVFETEVELELTRGEIYQGNIIDKDTTIVSTFTAGNGCDSLVITNITVTTTSLREQFAHGKVKVYPNPTSLFINIVFEKVLTDAVTLSLYNVLGQQLAQVSTTKQVNQIDMNHYPEGTYWLVLRSGGEIHSEKVVLMR